MAIVMMSDFGSWDVLGWTFNHPKASASTDCHWRCGMYLDYDDNDDNDNDDDHDDEDDDEDDDN